MMGYVVVVKLKVFDNKLEHFMLLLADNARKTNMEDGCVQFDICVDKNSILLYEIYKDKKDFEFHLKSEHYKSFDNLTKEHIKEKDVEIYNLYDYSN